MVTTEEYLHQLVPFARQVSEKAQDLYENPPYILISSFDPYGDYDEYGPEKPRDHVAKPTDVVIRDFRAKALATKTLADRMIHWGEKNISVEERIYNSMSILNAFVCAAEELDRYTSAGDKAEHT